MRPDRARRSRRAGDRARRTAPLDGGATGPASWLVDAGQEALAGLLAFAQPADAGLRRFFRDHPGLGRRDRGFIADTAFAVLRRLRHYERLAQGRRPRRMLLAAAIREEGADPAGFSARLGPEDRRWCEQVAGASVAPSTLGEAAEFPDWLVERLQARLDAPAIETLGRALQAPAPLDLRVNPLRATREAVLAQLVAEGHDAATTPWSPWGIRLATKPALERHPLYLDGTIEVQDEGSQLVALLLAPRRRELVVDFCAGAGGKTLLLGALMRSEGRLYALDVSERRLARLRTRMGRAGLSNVHPAVIAHESDTRVKRLIGKADRVLVDAPCTGFGTTRRNPDLKWRNTPGGLGELVAKQRAILGSAARLVRPGGRLVYATCSFLPDENEDVVTAFLASNPEFAQRDAAAELGIPALAGPDGALRLTPQDHGTDAFYAVVLERGPVRDADRS